MLMARRDGTEDTILAEESLTVCRSSMLSASEELVLDKYLGIWSHETLKRLSTLCRTNIIIIEICRLKCRQDAINFRRHSIISGIVRSAKGVLVILLG
jgi:hypothetical protein